MKRKLISILVCVILVLLNIQTVMAEDAEIAIGWGSDIGWSGDIVLPVSISETVEFSAFTFEIKIEGFYLDRVFIRDGVCDVDYDREGEITWVGDEPISGDQVLFYIVLDPTMDPYDAGYSGSISLEGEIYDTSGNELSFSVIDGYWNFKSLRAFSNYVDADWESEMQVGVENVFGVSGFRMLEDLIIEDLIEEGNNSWEATKAAEYTVNFDSDYLNCVGVEAAEEILVTNPDGEVSIPAGGVISGYYEDVSSMRGLISYPDATLKNGDVNFIFTPIDIGRIYYTLIVSEGILGLAPSGSAVELWPVETVIRVMNRDQDSLIVKIVEAQELYDSSSTGNNLGEYPLDAKEDFGEAINYARCMLDHIFANQEDIDNELTILIEAINSFKDKMIEETKEDVNGNGSVDVSDLAIISYYYLAKEGDSNWTEAQIADVNGNGIVDIEDLVEVASYILN